MFCSSKDLEHRERRFSRPTFDQGIVIRAWTGFVMSLLIGPRRTLGEDGWGPVRKIHKFARSQLPISKGHFDG